MSLESKRFYTRWRPDTDEGGVKKTPPDSHKQLPGDIMFYLPNGWTVAYVVNGELMLRIAGAWRRVLSTNHSATVKEWFDSAEPEQTASFAEAA
jgi:hypothetical protein